MAPCEVARAAEEVAPAGGLASGREGTAAPATEGCVR